MSILLILVVISKTADAQVTRVINDQGCQMKISIESHTVLKNARKKTIILFKDQKENQALFLVLQFICHKKHQHCKNLTGNFLRN